MQNIMLQLERLRRHFDESVKKYDVISITDLSHTLRVWTDLKVELPVKYPGFETRMVFPTASPVKRSKRLVKGHHYVMAYFPPDGVNTVASQGVVIAGPLPSGAFIALASAKFNVNGSVNLRAFVYVSRSYATESPEARRFFSKYKEKRCNFTNWLGSEAVRLRYLNKEGKIDELSISREQVIRRVANCYGGSHPVLSDAEDSQNRFDEPIQFLMTYTVGGLPLPYFLLLKMAKDILDVAPDLLVR